MLVHRLRWTVVVLGLAAGLWLGSPSLTRADFTIFTNRTAFNAALASDPTLVTTVQGFDTLPNGTIIPNGSTLDGVTYNYGFGNGMVTNQFASLSSPNTLGGTPFDFFDGGGSVTLTFDTPIVAFGISFNTFASLDGAYRITTNNGEAAPSFFDPFPSPPFTGQFAGLLSDTPFTSVVVSRLGTFQVAGLDDLTYARPAGSAVDVPEPGTVALVTVGALILLGCGWRRQRTTTPGATNEFWSGMGSGMVGR